MEINVYTPPFENRLVYIYSASAALVKSIIKHILKIY